MTAAPARWIYRFGGGSAEGAAAMKELLGGKGANLAEMSNLGLPVPPGFSITTEVCSRFFDNGGRYPEGLGAAGRGSAGLHRPASRRGLRESGKPAPGFGAFGRQGLHARHDGYRAQSRPQR